MRRSDPNQRWEQSKSDLWRCSDKSIFVKHALDSDFREHTQTQLGLLQSDMDLRGLRSIRLYLWVIRETSLVKKHAGAANEKVCFSWTYKRIPRLQVEVIPVPQLDCTRGLFTVRASGPNRSYRILPSRISPYNYWTIGEAVSSMCKNCQVTFHRFGIKCTSRANNS